MEKQIMIPQSNNDFKYQQSFAPQQNNKFKEHTKLLSLKAGLEIARCYKNGIGVQKDLQKAKYWFRSMLFLYNDSYAFKELLEIDSEIFLNNIPSPSLKTPFAIWNSFGVLQERFTAVELKLFEVKSKKRLSEQQCNELQQFILSQVEKVALQILTRIKVMIKLFIDNKDVASANLYIKKAFDIIKYLKEKLHKEFEIESEILEFFEKTKIIKAAINLTNSKKRKLSELEEGEIREEDDEEDSIVGGDQAKKVVRFSDNNLIHIYNNDVV